MCVSGCVSGWGGVWRHRYPGPGRGQSVSFCKVIKGGCGLLSCPALSPDNRQEQLFIGVSGNWQGTHLYSRLCRTNEGSYTKNIISQITCYKTLDPTSMSIFTILHTYYIFSIPSYIYCSFNRSNNHKRRAGYYELFSLV